jgi:hypothetical protein
VRSTPLTRLFVAASVVAGLLAVAPAAGAVAPAGASGQASVSFPLAVPGAAAQRLTVLARTAGHGAQRAAAVRALAPAPDRAAAVVRWAQEHGFRVVSRSAWLVEVRGPAGALAAALGTTATTRTLQGARYPVAAGALHVPAALRGTVAGVVGLDERPVYHRRTYGGGDLQTIQRLPATGNGAGTGVTVGTLNLSGWHPEDLTEYVTAYGLPVPAVQSVVVGSGHVRATAAEDAGGDVGEVALDVQAVAGTAPGATQRMYFGGNTNADFVAILSRMADDAAAGVLQTASTSWGICETDPALGAGERAVEAAQIDRMVAAGATFFAASGDSGAFDCGGSAPAVDWPAAQASTVGVGGTRQTGDAVSGYGPPASWQLYQGGGSGGGCSQTVARPAYQTAAVCPSGRAVPDLASLADPATGYATYNSVDGWTVMGGTSLAAPLSAAALAVFLGSQADKHGVGNILPAAYAHPEAFQDIQDRGSNGAYGAVPGYDAVTGLGLPDWRLLGAAVRGVAADPAPAPSSRPYFAPPPAWNGLTVPFFADLNGGHLDGQRLGQGADTGCSSSPGLTMSSLTDTFELLPGTADGPVPVTLSGQDPGMGCRATTRTVFLDRQVPRAASVVTSTGTTTPRFALSWSFSDPAPSSGLAAFDVRVTDQTTRAVRVDLTWTTLRRLAMVAAPGHLYQLQVTGYDRAGNPSLLRTQTFRAPYDDRSATLSAGWGRVRATPDYLGSHVVSARRGATLTIHFTGRSLTAGLVKSRYGGYADLYLDGVKKVRLNLYAGGSLYRQTVRLVALPRSGRHTVVIRVLGTHQPGARGSYVYLDSFSTG